MQHIQTVTVRLTSGAGLKTKEWYSFNETTRLLGLLAYKFSTEIKVDHNSQNISLKQTQPRSEI